MSATPEESKPRAFALALGMAAIATHKLPSGDLSEMVQIVAMGGGACVAGRRALLELQKAVHFALEGDPA